MSKIPPVLMPLHVHKMKEEGGKIQNQQYADASKPETKRKKG